MKSTSIFINQNASFDNYFSEMKKRNLQKSFYTNNNNTNGNNIINNSNSFTMTSVKSATGGTKMTPM